MRDHIRREARLYADAAWWLVPVAFAAVALAAVAFSEGDGTQDSLHAAVVQPAPQPAATPVRAMPAPQPAESAFEVPEHVQAF